MAEVPSTHYVKSDDVYIAYQVLGEGSLDLIFVPGFVSNVEAMWQSPNRSRFLRRLASFCRVIIFDKRGTGMSDRGSQIFTLEQRMHDVQTILNEVGSNRAALFGISEGGPMSLLYAATYPERTSALVLYGTYAKRLRTDDYPWAPTRDEWERIIEQTEREWGGPFGWDSRAPSAAGDERLKKWWATYLRLGASPGATSAIWRMAMELDVRHILPSIHVPTLVLHRSG